MTAFQILPTTKIQLAVGMSIFKRTTRKHLIPSSTLCPVVILLPTQQCQPTLSTNPTRHHHSKLRKSYAEGYVREAIMRTFPIWGFVLTLIITCVPAFKIKGILTKQNPHFLGIQFGTYGDFRISASVVLQLKNILTYLNLNWKYEVFYVLFLIPFVLVSVLQC